MTTSSVRSSLTAMVAMLLIWSLAGVAAAEPQAIKTAQQTSEKSSLPTEPQLAAARHAGWLATQQVLPALEKNDAKTFPGIAAWTEDVRKAMKGIDAEADPSTWPAIDAGALVTKNANFWRAHYEVAPGDPALVLVHAGLLLLGSEPRRASYVLMVGLQRPGIPAPIQRLMRGLAAQADKALEASNEATLEGIRLFDEGKLAEALERHEAALELCPQNGFAHYEWGLTRRQQEWKAAGVEPAKQTGIAVNEGLPSSKDVAAAFARARKHDPFQWKAYQGNDKETIASLMVLLKKGMPNWEKLIKTQPQLVKDQVVLELAEGLQGARQDELALVARQIVVARRGRFAPEDHPFIALSLRRMAPGEAVELALERLAGDKIAFRQIIAPEKREAAP